MQKWEYLREAIGSDDMAARGLEGWEYVGTVMTSISSGLMVYKRPLVEAKPEPEVAPEPELEPEHAAVPHVSRHRAATRV